MPTDDKDDHRPRGDISPEDRSAIQRRSAELGRKLDEVNARKGVKSGGTVAGGKAYSLAFHFMATLLAGVGIGVAVGWWLDQWLNTTPLFLIVFMLLGFVAGMRSVIQAANKEQARHPIPKVPGRIENENDK